MAGKLTCNPWKAIWNKPRQTIREIVRTNPSLHLFPLSMIYGFPVLVHLAQFFSLGAMWSTWAVVLVALILSPIVGYIGISFWSILVKWTGNWIGGKGSYREVRASVAWANVPNLVNVISWIVLAALLGAGLFTPGISGGEVTIGMARALTIIFGVQLVVSIWAFVILIIGLSEVQKFSVLRAICNILIPCVILVALGWVLNTIMLGMQG